MITNHAVAAARCTGTWQQRWNCGLRQPNPATAQAGYNVGHNVIPVLFVLLIILLVARAVKKRKKGRSAAPAGVGR